MIKARKYVVKKHFRGIPRRDDFEVVEFKLPELKDGEVMVKTEWISVDPYLRAWNSMYTPPFDQFSMQIGKVIKSNDPKYPVGVKIVSHIGWCDYGIVKITEDPMNRTYQLPDLRNFPTSYGIGAVGIAGATAYFGLLDICKPKPGETIAISSAAGAVGSLVGQIAKIKGCKVIGFTGSDEKVKWLENDLGFHRAFNYKTKDVTNAIQEVAPEGVDCYFDNVGGEISSMIIRQMNILGRVACCGSISTYNSDPNYMPKVTVLQQYIVRKQLKLEGFNVSRWRHKWHEAFGEILNWIENEQLNIREHVTVGFDKVFDAFVGMLSGENFGKAIVKV